MNVLKKKYKQPHRIKNARKRANGNSLAAKALLNHRTQNERVLINTQGNQIISNDTTAADYAFPSSSNNDYDKIKAEPTDKKSIDDEVNSKYDYRELLLKYQKLKEKLKKAAEDRQSESAEKDSKISKLE
jgi:hypothetical protein